jgi:hemoglobin/transferrin/lactoferrin receptor protein
MLLRILSVHFLFICCILPSSAQIVHITDHSTDLPLEMVTIASEKPRAFVTTNSKGQADIHLFKGSEKIEIRMLGYKALQSSYAILELAGFKVQLTPTGVSLDELIISATRWGQKSREVPAKVSSISAKNIELQNPQTAADMLATSGEVFIQKSQQGGGSPMIRGFSTNRLLYAVDGVRMNTAIFRSGNLQNVISLDPFATENTEVLFGPGSVIYGSDAIGGVMSFRTIEPKLSVDSVVNVSGKAILRTSSANNEKSGHVHAVAGWQNFAMVTSFSHFNHGDLKMGGNGPDDYLRPFYVQRTDTMDQVIANADPLVQKNTGYTQNNIMQKFRFSAGDAWQFDYGFHYSETSNYDRYDRLIRTRNGLPRSAEWYYGPQVWMMHLLTILHREENLFYDEFTLRAAKQKFEESRIDRDFNDETRRSRVEKVDAWSANLDFVKASGEKHKFYYGFEAVMNDVESTGTDEDITTGIKVKGPSRYPQSDWASYAGYLNYQYRLSSRSLVQAGARYNRYVLNAEFDTTFYPFPFTKAEIDKGSLTGSIGLVFNPNDKWVMSVNASTGFRAPNVDDMGKVFDSEAGSVVVPNPDLKSENAYNIEAGMAKIFGESLKVDLTGYYTHLQDAMVRRDFKLGGADSIIYNGELSQVQAVQNAASAYVYGVQAGVEMKFPDGWGITARFNYQKGEEELDDGTKSPLRHAAPMFGTAHLTYSIARWNFDLYGIFNGEVKYKDLAEEFRANDYLFAKDENGNPYSPSWYTINLKMSFKAGDNLLISGGMENITDQRYRTYSSGIAAAGRNFMLSATVRF